MSITKQNKQEADKVIELYKVFQHSVNVEYWAARSAIQDRQSVLDALNIVYATANNWNESIRKIQSMIINLNQQIEYLKSKI